MNEECPKCSTVSSPLPCGHWSCRVCNYKVENKVWYMECETCKNHTTLNENEQLYILYVERTQTK